MWAAPRRGRSPSWHVWRGEALAVDPVAHGLLAVWFLLLGLCVGSFLNVVICRMPAGESIRGRSHCPSCKKELLSRDLVPVVSQLLLRSRCRFCGEKFSWRYLIVESLVGLMFVLLFLHFGLERLPELVTFLVAFSALFALFVIDFETYLIPEPLWIAILVAGVGYDVHGIVTGQREMMALLPIQTKTSTMVLCAPQSVVGAVVGLVGLRAFVFLADLAFRKETMGFGDVYLTAAAGAHLGPGLGLLLYVVLAACAGAVIGIALMAVRKDKREDTMIPFGPFLAVSLAVMMLYGDSVTTAVRTFLFPHVAP
jgi:leader peptidase (prepilin peptidase) / N-methyltransferase